MTKTSKTTNVDSIETNFMNGMVEHQKTQNYLLTIFTVGCKLMSGGNTKREVLPQRSYTVVSVNEIDQYTKFLKQPFWTHPNVDENTSEDEQNDIPFEEKKWGRYSNIIIEPLSKDLEESYLNKVKEGFFEPYRNYYEVV